MEHIELFAGCGGLNLGLKSLSPANKLVFANEISPMASETFSFNFFNENLLELADSNKEAKRTLWLNSKFSKNNLKKRLRENPQEKIEDSNNDLENITFEELTEKIIVGDIIDLNNFLEENDSLRTSISNGIRGNGIDLVSGGPPCQSFSLAGLREFSNSRNQLPWEFAKFVNLIKPKIALLENVTGILRPFEEENIKVYAWYEVAKAFASIGYKPLCLHINAKYVGVAQNRPRYVMIAIRSDIFDTIISNKSLNKEEVNIFSNIESFYQKVEKKGEKLEYGHLKYYDIEKDNSLYKNTFLKLLRTYEENQFLTITDAIDDLRNNGKKKSEYVKNINTLLGKKKVPKEPLNHELRNNSEKTQSRFRLYQILSKIDTPIKKDTHSFLKDPINHKLESNTIQQLLKYKYLINGELQKFTTSTSLINHLEYLKTKKQTQKALLADLPAPAALSIPDDSCHYHENELRSLSVREMARTQSFPDWFEFRSKITTGGKNRRFEVPQYTQVGNAVPPLLGRSLGIITNHILELSDSVK